MSEPIPRRSLLRGALAAVAAPSVILGPARAATTPIRFASIDPLTGPAAQYGRQNLMALGLAVDRVNRAGGLLGREVQVVPMDYELKNDVGARRVREALMDLKVDAITTWSGAMALIAAQAAAREKKFFITPQSVPIEITTEQFAATTYVGTFNSAFHGAQMASYAAKSPHQFIYLFNPDSVNGRSFVAGFRKRFAKVGRSDQKIVGDEYFGLFSINDFSPYVTKIEASGSTLVPTIAYGSDLRNFLQQGHALGWRQRVASWAINDPGMCRALGPASLGHVAVVHAMLTADTPLMNQLIKEWTSKYKVDDPFLQFPELGASRTVYTWLWFMDAVRRAGSLDVAAVARTFEGSSFDTPWGRSYMRPCDHQILSPGYYAEIVKPEAIPEHLRFFGMAHPYTARGVPLASDEIAVDLGTPANARCKG